MIVVIIPTSYHRSGVYARAFLFFRDIVGLRRVGNLDRQLFNTVVGLEPQLEGLCLPIGQLFVAICSIIEASRCMRRWLRQLLPLAAKH